MMISQDKLIQQVRSQHENGIPNGLLLGWDSARFHQSLALLFSELNVLNETDFNYSFCNSYSIELGRGSDDSVYILTLKASFIADVYTVHVTKYSSNMRTGKVILEDQYPEYSQHVKKAHSFMEDQGFIELADDDMDCPVIGVELELAENATLEKCLFDDFE